MGKGSESRDDEERCTEGSGEPLVPLDLLLCNAFKALYCNAALCHDCIIT